MDGLIVFFVISFARGFNCYYFLSVHYEPKFHEMKLACNVLVSCVCLLRDVCVFVRSRSTAHDSRAIFTDNSHIWAPVRDLTDYIFMVIWVAATIPWKNCDFFLF